jgi:hypothetical protein
MIQTEKKLLDELKQSLEGTIPKALVDAYVVEPGPESIVASLLKILEQEVSRDEHS